MQYSLLRACGEKAKVLSDRMELVHEQLPAEVVMSMRKPEGYRGKNEKVERGGGVRLQRGEGGADERRQGPTGRNT